MKKLSFILLLICIVMILPAALAEQTLLTTVVPNTHTLTVFYGEGGTININGTILTAGESVTIERHERIVIEIRSNPGFELDTATVSLDRGVSLQGNNIIVAEMVKDIVVRVNFTRTLASYTVSFDANGGTGTMADVTGVSGTYALPICGFTPPDGKQFKAWQIGTIEYQERTPIEVTTDITVTAVWENIPPVEPNKYAVTVVNGSGSGVYEENTSVTISSDVPEAGKQFVGWTTEDGIIFADSSAQTTTFIMPAHPVTVIATYDVLSEPDKDVIITNPIAEQMTEVYEGEMASMTVTAENAEAYQWFVNYGDGTGWHKRGENQPSYTTSPVTLTNDGYRYKCIATGVNGSTAESAIFTLRVLEKIELPETGDNTNPPLLCAMLLISCFGILILRKHCKQILN